MGLVWVPCMRAQFILLTACLFQANHLEKYNSAKKAHGSSDTRKQCTLNFASADADSKQSSFTAKCPKQIELTDAITDLVADSMLPLQLVETPGFKKFMSIVEPRYKTPSRRTIARRLLNSVDELKDQCRAEIQEAMSYGDVIHFTMDLWSSRAMEPIAGIRMHFFDASYKLQVKTACYRHFGEKHTGGNIAAVFTEMLDSYGIEANKAGYQVTDNAKNMIKAFDLFSIHAARIADDAQNDTGSALSDNEEVDEAEEVSDNNNEVAEFVADEDGDEQQEIMCDIPAARRLPCTVHTLQLVVKDAVQQTPVVDRMIKDASAVISFFHRSLHWGCELKKATGGLSLLAAVQTRWNSNLIMLRRLVQENVWRAVVDVLARAKNMQGAGHVPRLSSTRSQVEELVSVLEPFEEATNILQGDGITSSVVIPAILGIDTSLAENTSSAFNTFKLQLRSSLQRRFCDILCTPEYVLATLLDPRYKLLPFNGNVTVPSQSQSAGLTPVQSVCAGDARKMLLECTNKMEVGHCQTNVQAVSTTAVDSSVKKSILHKFTAQASVHTDQSEDSKYFAMPTDSESSPAQYWLSAQRELPCMAKLARRYVPLCG